MTDTQPTPPPDLDAIQAALTVLGDAPWYTDDFEIHAGHPDHHTIDAPWIGETCNVELPDHGRARAEAIVTIHNALPALIARVRGLEARTTSLEAERDGWAETNRNQERIWAARVAELEAQLADRAAENRQIRTESAHAARLLQTDPDGARHILTHLAPAPVRGDR